MAEAAPLRLLRQEAHALLSRLGRIRPFALNETMVPAAAPSSAAQAAIEAYLATGRRDLRQRVRDFITWLDGPGQAQPAVIAQRRFTFLRMRFNVVLSQFDLFADVLTQRSEHDTGVWLAGLDVAAEDALALPGGFYQTPPLVCYIDRGPGAAIRRARTRLPGGGENPVAVIRVPRERMIGSGIAASLVHEVGHQAAELLGLVKSLRQVLQGLQRAPGSHQQAWRLWERWISEIVADLWAVGRVGIAAPLGLMAVVSLPTAFVFRLSWNDPHPMPWIRVKLSCAMGDALYPDAQWARLAALWESLYPTVDLDAGHRALLGMLEQSMPAFVGLLVNHRPLSLRGASLRETLAAADRAPAALARRLTGLALSDLTTLSPTLAFAVLGQSRVSGTWAAGAEGEIIARLLRLWALGGAFSPARRCGHLVSASRPTAPRALALAT